jgi:hypothetical protein
MDLAGFGWSARLRPAPPGPFSGLAGVGAGAIPELAFWGRGGKPCVSRGRKTGAPGRLVRARPGRRRAQPTPGRRLDDPACFHHLAPCRCSLPGSVAAGTARSPFIPVARITLNLDGCRTIASRVVGWLQRQPTWPVCRERRSGPRRGHAPGTGAAGCEAAGRLAGPARGHGHRAAALRPAPWQSCGTSPSSHGPLPGGRLPPGPLPGYCQRSREQPSEDDAQPLQDCGAPARKTPTRRSPRHPAPGLPKLQSKPAFPVLCVASVTYFTEFPD